MRRSTASVKAPRSWPKSSLSISPSGIPAQFTATKGPWLRGPSSWIARATSSLPVPLSPRISTVTCDRRHAPDRLEDLLHRGAAAEQAAELLLRRHLRAQPHDLALELPAREQLAHLDAQRLHLEGLGQVVGGAALHGLDGGRDGLGAAQHDHRRRRVLLARAPRSRSKPLRPGITRSSRIRSGGASASRRKRVVDARGGQHLALVLEQHAERFLHSGLVVDDQDARHARSLPARRSAGHAPRPPSEPARQRRSRSASRRPALRSTVKLPCCARTTSSASTRASEFSTGETPGTRPAGEPRWGPWKRTSTRRVGPPRRPVGVVFRREVDVAPLRDEGEAGAEQRIEREAQLLGIAARLRVLRVELLQHEQASLADRSRRASSSSREQRRDVDRFGRRRAEAREPREALERRPRCAARPRAVRSREARAELGVRPALGEQLREGLDAGQRAAQLVRERGGERPQRRRRQRARRGVVRRRGRRAAARGGCASRVRLRRQPAAGSARGSGSRWLASGSSGGAASGAPARPSRCSSAPSDSASTGAKASPSSSRSAGVERIGRRRGERLRDHGLELAQIPGPRVLAEHAQGVVVEAARALAVRGAEAARGCLDQRRGCSPPARAAEGCAARGRRAPGAARGRARPASRVVVRGRDPAQAARAQQAGRGPELDPIQQLALHRGRQAVDVEQTDARRPRPRARRAQRRRSRRAAGPRVRLGRARDLHEGAARAASEDVRRSGRGCRVRCRARRAPAAGTSASRGSSARSSAGSSRSPNQREKRPASASRTAALRERERRRQGLAAARELAQPPAQRGGLRRIGEQLGVERVEEPPRGGELRAFADQQPGRAAAGAAPAGARTRARPRRAPRAPAARPRAARRWRRRDRPARRAARRGGRPPGARAPCGCARRDARSRAGAWDPACAGGRFSPRGSLPAARTRPDTAKGNPCAKRLPPEGSWQMPAASDGRGRKTRPRARGCRPRRRRGAAPRPGAF